jgi:Tfp pilus assembly protein FimT
MIFSVVARLFFNKKEIYMKKYNNNPVKQLQKGFTFVELLVIMVIIAIIGGIGIQFVLSTQEDKAKLTNARTFFAKDFPNAVMSCMVRKNEVTDCDLDEILAEDIDPMTEWGDKWGVVTPASDTGNIKGATMTKRVASRSITICYPLEEVSLEDRATIATDLIEYMDDETSWTQAGDNTDGQGYAISASADTTSDDFKINGNTGKGLMNCKADNKVGSNGTKLSDQLDTSRDGAILSGSGTNADAPSDSSGEDDANFIEITYVVRRR